MRKNCRLDFSVRFPSRRAVVVDAIPIDSRSIPNDKVLQRYGFLHDIQFIPSPAQKVDFIIGVDLAITWCMPRDFRRGPNHLPFPILTDWGWTVLGGQRSHQTAMLSYLIQYDNDKLSERLDRIHSKPLPGYTDLEKISRDESRAFTFLNNSICLEGNQYPCAAPWKTSREETKQCYGFYR